MEDANHQLWGRCLDFIRNNIDKKPFQTWFSVIDFVEFKDKRLVIRVPTHFVYEFLDEQYAELIHAAIVREFGDGVKLIYQIGTPQSADAKDQPNEAKGAASIDNTHFGRRANQSPDTISALNSEPPQELDPQLNPNYTFDNFIEGVSNKLPRAVGLSIADEPGKTAFNPFFLFGPSGVGKTHLINAIGVRIKQRKPQTRVLYVSAHLFVVQYTDSVRKNKFNDFVNFYQTIDVLLIDDIQEIAGKQKTQQAFFNIFNHLQQNGKQIIMTCDCPPSMLDGMEERLLTRFRWGLIGEIEKPDTKLRLDILKSKIYRDGLQFPDNVVNYIAVNTTDNIRDLEGIVNSIMAYSIVYNCDIDMDLAQRVVKRAVNIERKPITVNLIIDKVGKHFNIKNKEICSSSRKQAITLARQVCMYLSQKHTGLSYAKIGTMIGRRDHSTVLHSCNMIERRISIDNNFRRELEEIESNLHD